MKLINRNQKIFPLVKRSDTITSNIIGSKGVVVENGRGRIQFKPTNEMVGMKYGEFIKTRTGARKRVTKGKSNIKPVVKKGSGKK